MPPTVAIVGRPNVGKSRLFNRLTRRRISIVHDMPGVTRDVVSAEVGEGYTLLDTGGFGLSGKEAPGKIGPAVDQQVLFAIEIAQVVLFVVDAHDGMMPADLAIAQRLRRSGKPVVVVANKADNPRHEPGVDEAHALGLGEPVAVSAEHGIGEEDLRARIAAALSAFPPAPAAAPAKERRLRICFVGRPNVGKSSIANRVLGAQRLIVSDVPGTTRESVELDFDYRPKKGGGVWRFTITDTAGLKKDTKLASPVEYFSQLRSIDSIERADVVYVVLDAVDGVGAQDKAIAGEAVRLHKPLVVVVNKWDLALAAFKEGRVRGRYDSEEHFRKAFAEAAERQLFFSPGSPVVFTSALTGCAIEAMLRAARAIDARLDTEIPTAQLNREILRLTERTPPPRVEGRRFRVYYAVQTGTRPFRIKLFCNQERRFGESYRRCLEAGLVEAFGLQGCPIMFMPVGKEPRGEAE
jgi:GTP-binding protein